MASVLPSCPRARAWEGVADFLPGCSDRNGGSRDPSGRRFGRDCGRPAAAGRRAPCRERTAGRRLTLGRRKPGRDRVPVGRCEGGAGFVQGESAGRARWGGGGGGGGFVKGKGGGRAKGAASSPGRAGDRARLAPREPPGSR